MHQDIQKGMCLLKHVYPSIVKMLVLPGENLLSMECSINHEGLSCCVAPLQADKIKADSAEAKRRAENEAAEAKQKAESEALRVEEKARETAANAQRDYEREIEEKLMRLPLEPSTNDPEAITVLVRSPKGQRFGRR